MDVLTLIYILATTAAIVYLYSKWTYSYWRRKGVPFIEPQFPYGNTREFINRTKAFGDQIGELYTKMKSEGVEILTVWTTRSSLTNSCIHLRKRYGGIYIFLRPIFIPIDLELVKCILQKNFTSFINHGMYVNEEDDPLTGHLFNLEDEKWRNMRTKLSPTFTSGKMKMMFQTLVDCSKGLEDIFKSHQLIEDPMDIKDVVSRFTTDVIGSCAFGIDCNSIKNPDSEFRQFGRRIFIPNLWRRIKGIVTMVIPNNVLVKLHYKQTSSEVEDFFMKVVNNTITYRESNNIYRRDFMHLMLQLKNRGEVTEDENVVQRNSGKKSQGVLSLNEVAAQCFVFFLAGFETSATTMTFALCELATNPQIQDRLREEMRSVLKKHDGQMTYEAIMEMTYLDRVVHETLRKHPPVPGTPRICNASFRIPGTDVVLEPGTKVHIPFQAIQRDPEYYPKPEKFDPDRFSEENKAKRPAYAFLPFGEGPRICIGARFGLMQAKVGLTAILSKFRVKPNKKMILPIRHASSLFITSVEGGAWLDVENVD